MLFFFITAYLNSISLKSTKMIKKKQPSKLAWQKQIYFWLLINSINQSDLIADEKQKKNINRNFLLLQSSN